MGVGSTKKWLVGWIRFGRKMKEEAVSDGVAHLNGLSRREEENEGKGGEGGNEQGI